MEFEYAVEGVLHKVRIERKDGRSIIHTDGRVFEGEIFAVGENELVFFDGRRARPVFLAGAGNETQVFIGGRTIVLRPPARETTAAGSDDPSGEAGRLVRSPMPGKVIKILAAEGDAVRRNQGLIIVEAMKMENEIKAACGGVVRKIHAGPGDLVDAEKILVEIEPQS